MNARRSLGGFLHLSTHGHVAGVQGAEKCPQGKILEEEVKFRPCALFLKLLTLKG